MPLNPNGKIDKPKLPFPDTVQTGPRDTVKKGGDTLTPTEKSLSEIWGKLLPNAPSPIPLDESFFDLGGHSILATRLTFEIRKTFVVDASLSLVFDHPMIRALSTAIDIFRQDDLSLNQLTAPPPPSSAKTDLDYATDYEKLAASSLRQSYEPLTPKDSNSPLTVFLTGGTGFLGSFILAHLLNMNTVGKVVCLVRGKNKVDALERLRSGSSDRGAWQESWVNEGRLAVVVGDLSEKHFGLDEQTWDSLCDSVDSVVHNGALVGHLSKYWYITNVHRFIGFIHTQDCAVPMFLAR
jgi:L-2-aminoadipate reductase